MGGRQYPKGIQTVLQDLFPDAMAIASTAPEILGAHPVAVNHPRDLADVDVAVVRAAFGVAETGSVLLVDQALATHALVYLAQHLIVLLDPAEIVPTLQEGLRSSGAAAASLRQLPHGAVSHGRYRGRADPRRPRRPIFDGGADLRPCGQDRPATAPIFYKTGSRIGTLPPSAAELVCHADGVWLSG